MDKAEFFISMIEDQTDLANCKRLAMSYLSQLAREMDELKGLKGE